jgi:MinD-like ATPase involved in chromosome partitioning or flagellar assembly
MALIAIASDKGAPGVTTAALALAAVWPRPVLLAECDPAGGDLVYRFPAADGGHLDPRRGVLSLAVVARRGMQPQQVWEHTQKLPGGLDVLAGVTNAEQGAGLSLLWGPIGKILAALPQADVIADCGRLGADGPLYDLLAEATTVVLVTKVHVADVIRLRDRAAAFAAAAASRGRRGFGVGVVVVADHKKFRAALGEVQQVLGQANARATVLGGIAHDVKGADLLGGEWGGNLDRTLLIKTAREVAQHLLVGLPAIASPAAPRPPAMNPEPMPPSVVPPSVVPPSVVPSSVVPSSVVPSSVVPPSVVPPSVVPPSVVPPLAPAAAAAPLAAGPATASPGAIGLTDSPVGEFPAEGRSGGSPRRAFSRVRGTRSGRHQADPGQALYAGAPIADVSASNPGQVRSTARHAQGSSSPVPASPAPSSQAPSSQAPSSPAPSSPAPSSQAPPDLGRASWMPDPAAGQGSSGPEVGPGRPEQEVDDWGSFGWSWSPGPMGSSRPGGG